MSLPQRFKAVFHLVVFLLIVTAGGLYAQTLPVPTNPSQTTPAVGLPEPKQTNPDAQYLPTPDQNSQVERNLPTGETSIKQTGAFDWVSDIPGVSLLGDLKDKALSLMNQGFELFQRYILGQITGCPRVDQPAGNQECQQKYQALLNGGTIADVENPGAIFMLAGVVDQGLQLPVPIHREEYIATINPFDIRRANAQAVDELEDSGLPNLWRGIRNAAFALSALVLVIIGFMIMFRSRLDPRTTITAMNSLPKVIFAIVLSYFSFALAGILLDLGRLALQFVYQLIPIQASAVFSGLLQMILVIILAFAGAFTLVGNTFGGALVGVIAALLLLLILAIIILIILIYVLIQMIKKYAQFIVYTIFAPFFFLWGALPGQNMFGWFKSQLSNVLAIPAMFLIIRLAAYIGFNSLTIIGNSNKVSLPSPFDVGTGFGVGLGTSGGAAAVGWYLLAPLISLALLFYATKMPAILDGILGIKDYGGRAGFGAGMIIGAPLGAISTVSSLNKASGALRGMSEGAVASGGIRGALATPIYSLGRMFGGNTSQTRQIPRYNADGQVVGSREVANRNFAPSARDLREMGRQDRATQSMVEDNNLTDSETAQDQARAGGVNPGPAANSGVEDFGGTRPEHEERLIEELERTRQEMAAQNRSQEDIERALDEIRRRGGLG